MLKMEDAHELLKREKMRFRQQRRLDRGMPKSVRLARLATDRSLNTACRRGWEPGQFHS